MILFLDLFILFGPLEVFQVQNHTQHDDACAHCPCMQIKLQKIDRNRSQCRSNQIDLNLSCWRSHGVVHNPESMISPHLPGSPGSVNTKNLLGLIATNIRTFYCLARARSTTPRGTRWCALLNPWSLPLRSPHDLYNVQVPENVDNTTTKTNITFH